MELVTKTMRRVDVIEISGRVDSNTSAQLEEALQALAVAKRFNIVLDMRKMEYISSRGLRALIVALKQARRWNRGDLRLCQVPDRIRQVLDLAGFTPLFKIYDNCVDAVGSF
jgi:anti-sigma B factor antagonist